MVRPTRSSSLDNLRMEELQQMEPQRSKRSKEYEYYKLMYAEVLYRWQLLYARTQILKFVSTPIETYRGVEFLTDCQHCKTPSRSCSCGSCRKLTLNCAVCHVSSSGSVNCCIICGHGGHSKHMDQWFEENETCAAGCGCHCLAQTAEVFD